MAMSPIYLDSIFAIFLFEISSWTNWIFSIFQTWILQATAGRKLKFKLGKNPVHQTGRTADISDWRITKIKCRQIG